MTERPDAKPDDDDNVTLKVPPILLVLSGRARHHGRPKPHQTLSCFQGDDDDEYGGGVGGDDDDVARHHGRP